MADDIEMDVTGIDRLLKAFRGRLPYVKVGILSGKNARKSGAGSNASIGLKHEFGSSGMPQRSFLRVPLTDNLGKYLDKSQLFDQTVIAHVIKDGSIEPWMQKIGVVAESVVLDGFATGGFGKWKPSNMARKKVQLTLVETQQLRNSITSEVSG